MILQTLPSHATPFLLDLPMSTAVSLTPSKRCGSMRTWIKGLAAKPGNLNWITGTHMGGEN